MVSIVYYAFYSIIFITLILSFHIPRRNNHLHQNSALYPRTILYLTLIQTLMVKDLFTKKMQQCKPLKLRWVDEGVTSIIIDQWRHLSIVSPHVSSILSWAGTMITQFWHAWYRHPHLLVTAAQAHLRLQGDGLVHAVSLHTGLVGDAS